MWGLQQAAVDAIKASATMHLTVCTRTENRRLNLSVARVRGHTYTGELADRVLQAVKKLNTQYIL